MPMEMKQVVLARDAENKELLKELEWRKEWFASVEKVVEAKWEWIDKATEEIKEAESWIRVTKLKVVDMERKLTESQNSWRENVALLDREKKKYPYEFPKFQAIEEWEDTIYIRDD